MIIGVHIITATNTGTVSEVNQKRAGKITAITGVATLKEIPEILENFLSLQQKNQEENLILTK